MSVHVHVCTCMGVHVCLSIYKTLLKLLACIKSTQDLWGELITLLTDLKPGNLLKRGWGREREKAGGCFCYEGEILENLIRVKTKRKINQNDF